MSTQIYHSCKQKPPNIRICVGTLLSPYPDQMVILYRKIINDEPDCAEEYFYDCKNKQCKYCDTVLT